MGIDAERGGAARRATAPKATPNTALPPVPQPALAPQTLETLFAKIGTTPDDRLVCFLRTMPPGVAESALQDPKIDLARAKNPSAYLMGVLQRRVAEASGSKRPMSENAAGYEGGRARGGKKQKAPPATADDAQAAGAVDAAVDAGKSGGKSAVVSAGIGGAGAGTDVGYSAVWSAVTHGSAGEYVEAAGSRKKARGGSASKQRREEARRLKQAQQQPPSGSV